MTNRCAATVYFCDVRVRLRTKSYYSGEVSFQVSNRYGDSQTKRISTDCPHCYSHIFNKHSNKAKTLKREKNSVWIGWNSLPYIRINVQCKSKNNTNFSVNEMQQFVTCDSESYQTGKCSMLRCFEWTDDRSLCHHERRPSIGPVFNAIEVDEHIA